MSSRRITIEVDEATGEAYEHASPDERRRIGFLLLLESRRALKPASGNLDDVMDGMSRQAQASGLTPEILEQILDER